MILCAAINPLQQLTRIAMRYLADLKEVICYLWINVATYKLSKPFSGKCNYMLNLSVIET